MDRRIKRTRTAVFNAVLDLMVEKDTSKITVLELCKRADINKSTFYLHYKSMEDCLQNCFQIIMNGIIDISKRINYYDIKRDPEPAVDKLLDELAQTFDEDKRKDLIIDIQQDIMDDAATVFFGYETTYLFSNKKVTGVKMYPMDYYWLTKDITLAE